MDSNKIFCIKETFRFWIFQFFLSLSHSHREKQPLPRMPPERVFECLLFQAWRVNVKYLLYIEFVFTDRRFSAQIEPKAFLTFSPEKITLSSHTASNCRKVSNINPFHWMRFHDSEIQLETWLTFTLAECFTYLEIHTIKLIQHFKHFAEWIQRKFVHLTSQIEKVSANVCYRKRLSVCMSMRIFI